MESVLRTPPYVLYTTLAIYQYQTLAGCAAAAYVHYPAVSQDMLDALDTPAFNNSKRWVRLRRVKAVYYRLLGKVYGWCGRRHDVVLANSSWTRGHISSVWGRGALLAYPPCGAMKGITRKENGKVIVLSLAQFRPEKDQMKQLEAWALLPPSVRRKAKLIIAGAVRHADDQDILNALKRQASGMDGVEFLVSAPRHEIGAAPDGLNRPPHDAIGALRNCGRRVHGRVDWL